MSESTQTGGDEVRDFGCLVGVASHAAGLDGEARRHVAAMLGVPVSVRETPLSRGLCKFRFELTPWLLATETDHGGQRRMGEIPMGTLLTTWHAIGPWRAPGRNQNSIQLIDHPVPVHSVSWLAALGGPLDVYIAGGYGPLMFATGGASEAAAGTANLVVGFSAK